MSDGKLCWYRVEFSPEGKLVETRPVDLAEASEDGGLVYYQRAHSAKGAEAVAYRRRQKYLQRERRARLRAEGKCDCGRALDGQSKQCAKCKAAHAEHMRRYHARKRGEDVPPMDRAVADAARREERERDVRLATYREAHRHFLANRTGFADWLRARIEALAGKDAA